MSANTRELAGYLRRLGRWMKARDAGVLAQRSLWLAALGALLVQLAGRVWPIEMLTLWSLLPFLGWLLVVLGWAVFAPASPTRIARRTDLELSLKERLSTALAFGGQVNGSEPRGEAQQLLRLQQEDALAVARAINPRHAFQLAWYRRPLFAALALAVLAVTVAFLPNQMDAVLAEREQVRAELEEQSRRMAEMAQELEQNESLSPEERDELLRQLEELARQLSENPGDREKALADFARLEENLRRQIQPDAASRQTALESLAAQLEALAREQGETAEAATSPGEALEQLASELAGMEMSEQQALAQSLADLAAQAAQNGEQALATALSAMAQAALNGDSQAANQSAQQASEALDQANQNAAAQQALAQALSQLQASRQAVAQAGQGRQTAQNQSGNQPGQNPGQNPGQGQGQNQGQNPGQGQATTGGGTRANTLPPSQGRGQAGQPQGPGQQANAGRLDDQVYVPFANPETNGEDVFIPGQDSGQGETEVREGQDPLAGAANPALVPYQQVFGQYLQAANQAVDSGTIPPSLRDYIKAYFTQLEP